MGNLVETYQEKAQSVECKCEAVVYKSMGSGGSGVTQGGKFEGRREDVEVVGPSTRLGTPGR